MTNAAGYAQQGVDLFHGHIPVAAALRYDYFRINLSIDNLTDKRYFETQNYFESRVSPGAEARARIH